MKKNQSITITPASNGFIINELMDRGACMRVEDSVVCRTMAELNAFLGEHFEHRAKDIPDD